MPFLLARPVQCPGGAAPRVESLGTGGGIQAFCQGVGPSTPDIANASRPLKASEFELCRTNGVTDIVELKIGYDGIVIATARTGNGFNFELNDLYEGLAKEVHRHQGGIPLLLASALAAGGTALALYLGHPKALWLAPAALATALLWAWRLKRRLGGQSGDLLGACAMLAEAACLLAWLAA